jgi:hypothetical protein
MLTYLQYEPGILINIYNLPSNFTGYVSRTYSHVVCTALYMLTFFHSRTQGLERVNCRLGRITVARWYL